MEIKFWLYYLFWEKEIAKIHFFQVLLSNEHFLIH